MSKTSFFSNSYCMKRYHHECEIDTTEVMIEVNANDRLGKKIKVKCLPEDTIGDLKKIISMQLGTSHEKIVLKKGHQVYKDHISLDDYEVHNGFNFELYYS